MTGEAKQPCALVTNDDGFDAPGLRHLASAAARAGYKVIVAAPMREASGSSASITAVAESGHVLVERRQLKGLGSTRAFAVDGSPALIALIATRAAFGAIPDVVLSGINRGANAGTAVLHSGTVGAALTAALTGRRALAVSLDLRGEDEPFDRPKQRHWNTAADHALRVLPLLMSMPAASVLNLNVPDLPIAAVRGLCHASLSSFGRVQVTEVEKGSGVVRISLEDADGQPPGGCDLALLARDYATVTAIQPVSEAPMSMCIETH
jgi:5'/3'-nucleotidase